MVDKQTLFPSRKVLIRQDMRDQSHKKKLLLHLQIIVPVRYSQTPRTTGTRAWSNWDSTCLDWTRDLEKRYANNSFQLQLENGAQSTYIMFESMQLNSRSSGYSGRDTTTICMYEKFWELKSVHQTTTTRTCFRVYIGVVVHTSKLEAEAGQNSVFEAILK